MLIIRLKEDIMALIAIETGSFIKPLSIFEPASPIRAIETSSVGEPITTAQTSSNGHGSFEAANEGHKAGSSNGNGDSRPPAGITEYGNATPIPRLPRIHELKDRSNGTSLEIVIVALVVSNRNR